MVEKRLEAAPAIRSRVSYRPGTVDDSHTVYRVFQEAILDLSQRLNVMAITGGDDPEVMAKLWQSRRPLFEHLARTAYRFWVAEAGGKVVGYARSILRGGVWDLTEFFVLPGFQSAGLGRELLARVLPQEEVEHRVIIATADVRALARYLKADVYARFPIVYFSRAPEQLFVESDLQFVPLNGDEHTLQTLSVLDAQLLGHRRDVEHEWLMQERDEGYLYLRDGQPVGYGYTGSYTGPFALLDPDDFPAVLAHAESRASDVRKSFGVEVPLVNQAAVSYLLERGFEMDSFYAFFMSDAPFGHFEHYIFPSPPFFL